MTTLDIILVVRLPLGFTTTGLIVSSFHHTHLISTPLKTCSTCGNAKLSFASPRICNNYVNIVWRTGQPSHQSTAMFWWPACMIDCWLSSMLRGIRVVTEMVQAGTDRSWFGRYNLQPLAPSTLYLSPPLRQTSSKQWRALSHISYNLSSLHSLLHP